MWIELVFLAAALVGGGDMPVVVREADLPDDETAAELLREQLLGEIDAEQARLPGKTLSLRVRTDLRVAPSVEPTRRSAASPTRNSQASSLYGKRIGISAGHGWIKDGTGYRTQRTRWAFDGCGKCRGITEDFYTNEFVTDYLLPLLQGMGAEVVLVREPDRSQTAVTLDTDALELSGAFASILDGYGGDSVRSSGAAQALAKLPALGSARLAHWFVADPSLGANNTLLVTDAGGEHALRLVQQRQGGFWLDVGPYFFDALSSVAWISSSAPMLADAVKVGGGIHQDSQKPMWQMGALQYLKLNGASTAVINGGDFSSRPLYAEEKQVDLYLAIHSNGASTSSSGTDASGISAYRYSCRAYDDYTSSDGATGCDDPPGSTALIDAVQGSALATLRQEWDPNFKDRGKRVANFAEVRNLSHAPGVLIETAYHDNIAAPSSNDSRRMQDNKALHDPRFREALALGLVRGLARYYNPNAEGPPRQRVGGLVAESTAQGVRLSFDPVAGATLYRVYRARHVVAGRERAFDSGELVSSTSIEFNDVPRHQTQAFRVAAVNAEGEGLASAAVAVRRGNADAARILLVHAYDRKDAWVQLQDNRQDASLYHASAWADHELEAPFDGATSDAVGKRLSLLSYGLVDWVSGKDSTEHQAIDANALPLLREFTERGGALILSGEEIAYAFRQPGSEGYHFVHDSLGVGYVADDAKASTVRGNGVFASLGELSLTEGVYELTYPDVVAPLAGQSVVLAWPEGSAAATLSDKTLFVGFGLEAIASADARAALFERAFAALSFNRQRPKEDTPGTGGGSGGESGGETGGSTLGGETGGSGGQNGGTSEPLSPLSKVPSITPRRGCQQHDAGLDGAVLGMLLAYFLAHGYVARHGKADQGAAVVSPKRAA